MHLDMIVVNFFRLIQFYDTLFELVSYIELVGGVFAILRCIFEKNGLKKWDFFIIGKLCFTRYKWWSRASSPHMFEETYKRQFLDKIFEKNNHHLDFMQGFISTSGVNTAFFHPKKWQNMLKIDFLGCHGNGQVVKSKAFIFLLHLT